MIELIEERYYWVREEDGEWAPLRWSSIGFWKGQRQIYPTAISGPIEPPEEEKR